MATSGTYLNALGIDEVVADAYERCGISSEQIVGHDMRSTRRSLNLIFSEWSSRGINLFNLQLKTRGLTQGQQTFTLDQGDIDVLDMVRRTTTNGLTADVVVMRFSREEYFDIPDKAAQGTLCNFWVDRQIPLGIVNLWPTPPDNTTQVLYWVLKQMQDVASSAEQPGIPYRWQQALVSALAVQVALKELKGEDLQLRYQWLLDAAENSFDLAAAEERERGSVKLSVDLSCYGSDY